jgi:hypothetical protein
MFSRNIHPVHRRDYRTILQFQEHCRAICFAANDEESKMIPFYPADWTDEMLAERDAILEVRQELDAKSSSDQAFWEARRRGQPVGTNGCLFDVPVWQRNPQNGFWERVVLEDDSARYRVFLHVWSDILKESVLVVKVVCTPKFAKRMMCHDYS